MRLFTKSWICIALALHPGTMYFNFRTAFQVTCWLFSPSLPFIFITSVPLVFRAGRHTHVFGLHLSMRLAMGLMPGTASEPGLQSSTHPMHLANEFDARL